MKTNCDPRDLATTLLKRSICHVQVAAVIADKHGVYGWAWNSAGCTGMGEHAEQAAVRRGNRKRFAASSIYVAAARKRNGKIVTAKPCEECQRAIRKIGKVFYRDKEGQWLRF